VPDNAAGQQKPIQSLDRGLVILETVAKSNEPVSLGALTSLLGIDRSSVFRLAGTLKRRGFLAYPAGRKDYILGPALWRLSHQYDWGAMLIRVSRESLRELASETKETAHLAVREGKHTLFIDHVTANHVIAVSGQTGELLPLYSTAHGKALLLDYDESGLRAMYGTASLHRYTNRTICTLSQLAKACAQYREQGFATDDGEYEDGIRCVAAPIRADTGTIIGSVGISAPEWRFSKDQYHEVGEQVRRLADQISTRLRSQNAPAGERGRNPSDDSFSELRSLESPRKHQMSRERKRNV
jgi:DNA-binding IclR family transcriptional regulator